jgi:flagellar assembly protein FliH
MQEIRPLPLRAFDDEVQARADLDKLRDEIKALEARREEVRDAARAEGLELGRADALQIAGKAERERVSAEAAGVIDLLRRAADGIEAKRSDMAAAAERDLMKLALAVAAKIVKAAVADGRPVARENLRRAIELTARRQDIKVLVSPGDFVKIEEYLPALRRDFADLHQIAVEADASLAPGGVVVQSREGSVDATIAAQLEEIERGLLG